MAITIISGSIPANIGTLATSASVSLNVAYVSSSYSASNAGTFGVNGINITFVTSSTVLANTADTIYINGIPKSTSATNFAATASSVFNTSASAANSATAYSQLQGVTSTVSASVITFAVGTVGAYVYANSINGIDYVTSASVNSYFTGATNVVAGGSATVTGSFTSVYAEVDSDITVSGSGIGQATFLLGRGNTYVPSSSIASIIVNNPFGYVVAQ